jgi:hypothetical protein
MTRKPPRKRSAYLEAKVKTLEGKMEMLKQWLPGASIKSIQNRSCLQIDYEGVTVYVPYGFAHEIQQTLLSVRDCGVHADIKDYLRLSLPSTLQEYTEFQKKRKAANRVATALLQAKRREEKAREQDQIREFFSDLTIEWNLAGFQKWTETVWGPEGETEAERQAPIFQYFLQWGGNSFSFTLSYRRMEPTNVDGDEPSWNWRWQFDFDSLYDEAEEQYETGKREGEIPQNAFKGNVGRGYLTEGQHD